MLDLAPELATLRANLIAAGFIDTPPSVSLLGDDGGRRHYKLRSETPFRWVVEPADVATLAVTS